jgi:hypothetical protein
MITTERSRRIGITPVIAALALAGCSDPQDIPFTHKSDSGASSGTAGKGESAGAGGNASSLTGANAAGSVSPTGGTGGASGSGGSASPIDTADAANGVDAAAPSPAKLGAVLFNADFEDGKTDPWTTYDGAIAISTSGAAASAKSLGFRTTAKNSIGKAVTAGAPGAKSFAIESDILFESGGQASLIFRVSAPSAGGPDNLTGYGVGLDTGASTVWIAKFANMWSPLGMETATLLPQTWYHLRIDARPGKLTVFLDGAFVIEVADVSLVDAGMIGVRGDWGPMGDGGTAPEVLFDNVKQSAIVESNAGM